MHQLEIFHEKIVFFQKDALSDEGVSDSTKRYIDTECFTLGIYEYITYHMVRYILSWGMEQLEIFMTKIMFFPKRCTFHSNWESQRARKSGRCRMLHALYI